jgi:hypothetical protein
MAEPVVPRVFEQADKRPLVIKEDKGISPLPVLGLGETDTTISDAAREDLELQQKGFNIQDVLKNSREGRTTNIGGVEYTPEAINSITKNEEAFKQLTLNVTKYGRVTPETETFKPLTRESEFTPTSQLLQNPELLSRAEKVALGRDAVDSLLLENGIQDARVRQIFVDEYITGNFYQTLGERLGEAGQFVGKAIPGLGILTYHAGVAGIDAIAKGTNWFDEWGGRQNKIKQSFDTFNKGIDKYLKNNPTMAIRFNNAIQDSLDKQLEEGRITQEEYDDILFIQDEQGNKVRKDIIDTDTADALVRLGMEQLPFEQQFAVIFTENALGMVGPGQLKGARSLAKLGKAVAAQKNKNPTLYNELMKIKDPVQQFLKLQASNQRTNTNIRNLSVGVLQQRTDDSVNKLADMIAEQGQKLDALKMAGTSKKDKAYILAKREYNDLTNRMLKAKYTARVYPYIKEVGSDALLISAGQTIARNLLPEAFGMNPETSEVVGMLGMVMGGKQLTKALAGAVVKGTSSPRVGIVRGITSTLDVFANIATLGTFRLGGLKFNDDTLRTYEMSINRKLEPDEIRGIRSSIKIINNLSPDERDQVLAAVDEYVELKNRIVNSFPEDQRKEVAELFKTSFGNATGLTMIGAVNSIGMNTVNVRELSNFKASTLFEQSQAAVDGAAMTEMALENLERMVRQNNLGESSEVFKFVQANRNAVQKFRESQIDLLQEKLKTLNSIRRNIIADPDSDIPENFLSDMVDADIGLRRLAGESVDEKVALEQAKTDIFTSLTSRLEILRGKRGEGASYYNNLGRTVEEVFDTQIDALWQTGHQAYEGVRQAAKNAPTIDLTESVEYLLNQAGTNAYETFFSAGGKFFAGRLGRQNLKVFNDMVERAIPNIDELKENLIAAGVNQELVEGMQNVELAMELKRINPDFNPFSQLNAYEVDVVRRSFRDYASSINNPELVTVYKNYETTLDNAIKQSSREMFTILEKARKTYRSEVGDRLRPGGFLSKIDKSRQGKEIVTFEQGDMFKYAYGKLDPNTIFRPISNNISLAIKGSFNAEQDIVRSIKSIETQFADTVDGQRVFDLTTEAGRAKFNGLRAAIGEKVFADFIDGAIKNFEGAIGTGFKKQGGYKLDNFKDMDLIHDLLRVKIKTKDGITDAPIVNLTDMYADHRNLREFVQGNKDAQKVYKGLVDKFNDRAGELKTKIEGDIRKQDNALAELSVFTGKLDADSFYSTYILNGSIDEIDFLKDAFIKSQVNQAGKSVEEAEALFNSAVGGLVSKGFKNRGGLQPVPEATFLALNRDVPVATQFMTPEQLLMDVRSIENGGVRENLVAVLGEEHVSYLEDISKFLIRSKQSSARLDGVVSAPTVAGIQSRLYGLARGVVNPSYVATEFMVNLALRSNISLLEMTVQNEQAANIISKMFKTPELVTKVEMEKLEPIVTEFVLTEMARQDLLMPELNEMFLMPDEENEDEG